MEYDFAFIWILIIGFAILMYVVLDGFDLGLGILFPLFPNKDHRSLILSTVIPVWDGNQTWLVFGGACMYGAFPKAFASILPMLYAPMIAMLIALIFRGVAFEFRMKAVKTIYIWDIAFFLGSSMAALCQGIILGTFVQGFGSISPSYINVQHYKWLTPFSFMTGIGTMCGYTLLACCWLIIKTKGTIQKKAYSYAKKTCILVAFFMLLFSIWTPFLGAEQYERWLILDKAIYLISLPISTIAFFAINWYSLNKKYEILAMISAVCIFLCGAIGVLVSTYPYIVPHSMTIYEAASSDSVLKFMLYGVCISMPILLFFTAHSYYVFKGKVEKAISY